MLSIGKLWTVDLFDLGRHGRIEHDASLVHGDTPEGKRYAPTRIHRELVEALVGDVPHGVADKVDFARMRVRREKASPKLSALHAEIARGEAALLLGVLSTAGGAGIPLEWLLSLLGDERIPDGWRPDHTQGLVRTVMMSREIKSIMEDLRRGPA